MAGEDILWFILSQLILFNDIDAWYFLPGALLYNNIFFRRSLVLSPILILTHHWALSWVYRTGSINSFLLPQRKASLNLYFLWILIILAGQDKVVPWWTHSRLNAVFGDGSGLLTSVLLCFGCVIMNGVQLILILIWYLIIDCLHLCDRSLSLAHTIHPFTTERSTSWYCVFQHRVFLISMWIHFII